MWGGDDIGKGVADVVYMQAGMIPHAQLQSLSAVVADEMCDVAIRTDCLAFDIPSSIRAHPFTPPATKPYVL